MSNVDNESVGSGSDDMHVDELKEFENALLDNGVDENNKSRKRKRNEEAKPNKKKKTTLVSNKKKELDDFIKKVKMEYYGNTKKPYKCIPLECIIFIYRQYFQDKYGDWEKSDFLRRAIYSGYFKRRVKDITQKVTYEIAFVKDADNKDVLDDNGLQIVDYQKDKNGNVKTDKDGNPIPKKRRVSTGNGIVIQYNDSMDFYTMMAILFLYEHCLVFTKTGQSFSISDKSILRFIELSEKVKQYVILKALDFNIPQDGINKLIENTFFDSITKDPSNPVWSKLFKGVGLEYKLTSKSNK